MSDIQELRKATEEMGMRKLALALYDAIEQKQKRNGDLQVIDTKLNFVEIEAVIREMILKIRI